MGMDDQPRQPQDAQLLRFEVCQAKHMFESTEAQLVVLQNAAAQNGNDPDHLDQNQDAINDCERRLRDLEAQIVAVRNELIGLQVQRGIANNLRQRAINENAQALKVQIFKHLAHELYHDVKTFEQRSCTRYWAELGDAPHFPMGLNTLQILRESWNILNRKTIDLRQRIPPDVEFNEVQGILTEINNILGRITITLDALEGRLRESDDDDVSKREIK